MLDNKTLDRLHKLVKSIPKADRMDCLSFLVANGLLGVYNDIDYCAKLASLYPENIVKKFRGKWRKRLENRIDRNKTRQLFHNLQMFCDMAVVRGSVFHVTNKLEGIGKKEIIENTKNIGNTKNIEEYRIRILFNGEVEQTMLLAEVVTEMKKVLEWKNYHQKYEIFVENYNVDAEFLPGSVLVVRLSVDGSNQNLVRHVKFENEYRFSFDKDGGLVVKSRDKYDSLGRRTKCRD